MVKKAIDHVAAFVDLGTNSVRLLAVRINANHSFTVLTQQKETVRLGEGEFLDSRLKPEAMQRAVQVCKQFAETARSLGATEINMVATAASREAKNRRSFIGRLRKEANLDVRVISGKEEARLIYLGVSTGVNLGDREALFLDIGGGSTEMIIGGREAYRFLDSLKLGAVRLSARFQPKNADGSFPPKQYQKIKQYVRNIAVRSLERAKQFSFEVAVGSSGTVENLAEIAALRFHHRPFEKEDKLLLSHVQVLGAELAALPLKERRKVPGINTKRADIIVAGAGILESIMVGMNVKEVKVSDRGLRDGMLVDYMDRGEYTSSLRHLPVRERSVLQLGRSLHFDEDHARNVSGLVLQLFDSAKHAGLHGYGEWERELLYFSGLLHDIGVFLSFNNHQQHSYYFIRNAELLGFNQPEIDIMAALALYHRKPTPRLSHPQFAALPEKHQKRVAVLSVLLRIAESLERGHSGVVRLVHLRPMTQKTLVLEISATQDCKLEMWGVQNHAKTFKKAFGRKLAIEVHVETAKSPEKAKLKV